MTTQTTSGPPGVIILKPPKEWLTKAHKIEGLKSEFTYPVKERRSSITAGEPVGPDKYNEGHEKGYDLSELITFTKSDYANHFEKVHGIRLRPWMLVALAVSRVLHREEFATLNGYWAEGTATEEEKEKGIKDQDRDKVALYTTVNLGFSYDRGIPPRINKERGTIGEGTPGLRILTLRDAHAKSCIEFLTALNDLFRRADIDVRAGSRIKETKFEEWTGATFIFNNIGALRHRRGLSTFPSLMSGLMNMGYSNSEDPSGDSYGRTMFQLFFDHRMVDGSMVTAFLDAVYGELMEPVLTEVRDLSQ
jgi:hypothetical protein